jgi:hypothetical protein
VLKNLIKVGSYGLHGLRKSLYPRLCSDIQPSGPDYPLYISTIKAFRVYHRDRLYTLDFKQLPYHNLLVLRMSLLQFSLGEVRQEEAHQEEAHQEEAQCSVVA